MDMRNRVLIVEDDKSCETLLRQIIHSVDPEAKIDWVENAEAAALTLVQERTRGVPYNLVISDIFLSGKLTGFDLWRIYREFYPSPPVVLTSSLPIPNYLEALDGETEIPIFLPKPFFAQECKLIVKRFMANI
jgi:DNA-binding NtrC family response regulator